MIDSVFGCEVLEFGTGKLRPIVADESFHYSIASYVHFQVSDDCS